MARQFGVSLSTVQRWMQRAGDERLTRVDWGDRPDRPRRTRRTPRTIEARVLKLRRELQHSVLGECGAVAIRRELEQQGIWPCPAVRTIGRILERSGTLDGRKRIRRPPPPKGWYLEPLAAGRAELDSIDTVEGLSIRRGAHFAVLTAVSLHGGLMAAWPEKRLNSRCVVSRLVEHWETIGLPAFAQFDNDNRFLGPKQHLDAIGRVLRCCLSLGVTPVVVPPNEMGFQAAIESFNGLWQSRVWSRWTFRSLPDLQARSTAYINAARSRRSARIEAAPLRTPFPRNWRLDLQSPPRGTIVFLRRTNDSGAVQMLGRTFPVAANWVHRLVRAEVDLNDQSIRFYALRRRAPEEQPLLRVTPYKLPIRRFNE